MSREKYRNPRKERIQSRIAVRKEGGYETTFVRLDRATFKSGDFVRAARRSRFRFREDNKAFRLARRFRGSTGRREKGRRQGSSEHAFKTARAAFTNSGLRSSCISHTSALAFVCGTQDYRLLVAEELFLLVGETKHLPKTVAHRRMLTHKIEDGRQ